MTLIRKICLPLFAAALLSGCKAAPPPPEPINPNTTATFEIRAVLQDRHGKAYARPPDGYVLGENVERFTDHNGWPLLVVTAPTIDTSCLTSISASEPDEWRTVLNFALTADCAKIFGDFTAKNLEQRMAVVINGEMLSAPYIRSPILTGSGFIEGGFETLAEAEAIANGFYE